MDKAEGIYARATDKLKEKMAMLKAMDWFYKADACELCGVNNRPSHQTHRDAIGQALYNWTQLKEPLLEQKGKRYRVINRDFKVITPGYSEGFQRFDFHWPRGVGDNTRFGFADAIIINKRDVIGLGGEGNKGKSLFGLSVAVENMDSGPVTVILSENVLRVEERLSHFDWADIYDENGNWKFEILEAKGADEFLDIIRERKDNLVIVDWLSVGKEAYLVRDFYDAASHLFDKGVGFIIQQKRTYKDWVEGGEGAYDYTSAFFLLQSGKIRVQKAKVWEHFDPTDKAYRFKISHSGSRFSDIAEVYDCPQCKGKKYYQGEKCGKCYGLGHLDVLNPEGG